MKKISKKFKSLRKYCIMNSYQLSMRKLREYPIAHAHFLMTTDTNLDTGKFICSEFCDYILESVLSPMTSFRPKSNFSKLHINIIRNNENILFWINLIKIYQSTHGIPWEIHIGHRLHENALLPLDNSFRNKCVKSRITPLRKSKFSTKELNKDKPDIMSSIFIFFSRISKSDNEFHWRKSSQFLCFVKSSYGFVHEKKK